MLRLDPYAVTYLCVLMATIGVACAWGHSQRKAGVGIMALSWLATIIVTQGTNQSPTIFFTLIDFASLIGFCAIAWFYQRWWAVLVVVFHVMMLAAHFAYEAGSHTNEFLYLSVLAGLGYASLLTIALPPIWQRIAGTIHEADDYLPGIPVWGGRSEYHPDKDGEKKP